MDRIRDGVVAFTTGDYNFTRTLGRLTVYLHIRSTHTKQHGFSRLLSLNVYWMSKVGKHGPSAVESLGYANRRYTKKGRPETDHTNRYGLFTEAKKSGGTFDGVKREN